MDLLKDRVALVTGASSGFGVGIASQLVKRGAKVYVLARRAEKLRDVATKIGAIPLVADITRIEEWNQTFDLIREKEGRLDILVNNAGVAGPVKPIDEQDDSDIFTTIQTNLTGAIWGCIRAAAIMKKQRSGTIVNISSVCAVQSWAGWGIYGAAKAGLEQFTRHLYVEMRPFGVRATVLTPSWGATDFAVNANISSASLEVRKRSIQPADIGEIVVNICLLPDHLVIPDITLLPLVQEIQPY